MALAAMSRITLYRFVFFDARNGQLRYLSLSARAVLAGQARRGFYLLLYMLFPFARRSHHNTIF